jgi:3-deoxy-D-manno-octulosonic-acid transferase
MHLAGPVAARHLRGRLGRGKEDPARWHEKRGVASAPRPEGPLVWLHAVGVGEVLALPGLATALRARRPDLTVLITSSSLTSAQALAPNLPEGAIHQFLPMDIRRWRRRFLDHWRPDLSVWAERDLWPGLIADCRARGIPLALVNGRMDAASAAAKARAGGFFRDLYARFDLIEVQDAGTARHIEGIGIPKARIAITGSLKTAAPPLADRPERPAVEAALKGRRLWLAASTHPGDETAVAEAHTRLVAKDPEACLILAPRNPAEAEVAAKGLARHGIDAAILPATNLPPRQAQAYVVAHIGQLGLWYRLATMAFVGGSLAEIGGHNPWEPARLDCAILHGPNTWNFAADYAALDAAGAALETRSADDIAAALTDPATPAMRPRAAALAAKNAALPDAMARRLIALMAAP